MKRQRWTFSSDFKQDAVSLTLDQGYSFAEASRAVDAHENTLRAWTKQMESERMGHTWMPYNIMFFSYQFTFFES